MQTSNPALRDDTFSRPGTVVDMDNAMTVNGVITKTALLLLIVILTASYTWVMYFKAGANTSVVTPWMIGGAIGGLILAFATIFKPEWASMTSPLSQLAKGYLSADYQLPWKPHFPESSSKPLA